MKHSRPTVTDRLALLAPLGGTVLMELDLLCTKSAVAR